MLTGIKIIILLAVGMLLGFPFFKSQPAQEAVSDQSALQLTSKRDHIYGAIKELEFDYNTGKLTEEDYRSLKKKYRHEAISILKQLDQIPSNQSDKSSEQLEV